VAVGFGRVFHYALAQAMRTQYDESDVRRVIDEMAKRIAVAFDPARPLSIIGIRTRGETLAQRLTAALHDQHRFAQIGRGVLDITLYRDDLSEVGPKPMVRPTRIDFDINGKPLLLVDDVLFTGRSIRAALDALSDFGRPQVIRLAVLVDRGGRELPIQPDFVGLTLKGVPIDHRANVHFVENDQIDEIVVEPKAG
jgi:pyrimidine operon attenuation protein/uracil phosphoribosyltransferase